MNSYEKTSFSVCSLFLLFSGVAQILFDIIIGYYKHVLGDKAAFAVVIAFIFLIASGALSFLLAIISLANRKRRIRTGALCAFGRLIIILTIVGCLFLGMQNIYAWQLVTAAFIGIFFPMIYVMSAVRKGMWF